FRFLFGWRFDAIPFRPLLRDHLDNSNRIAELGDNSRLQLCSVFVAGAHQTLSSGGPWSSWPSPILGRDRFGRLSCIHRTRANVFPPPSCPSCVLVAVVDRAGRGGTRKVKAAFEAVETRYAELGHTLQRPVSGEIVAIPIMGASKSLKDRHTLYVSSRAVESGLV